MEATLLVRGAVLCQAGAPREPVDIRVAGTRILAVEPAAVPAGPVEAAPARDVPALDAGGRTVVPGLIDVHVHGAGGADPMDGTPESVATMARTLARMGTTAFLATTLPQPARGNRHLAVLAEAAASPPTGGARLLGIHIEGPFVHADRRGGIPMESLLPPSMAALEEILALTGGALRMMTLAPELDGALPLIERLAAHDVIPSFGHSDADYEAARAGIAAGIRHATHLYNAMRGFHHRDPGPLVALHEAEALPVQIIADDVHVSRHVVRWTRRTFGHDRCIAISDGMRTTGLPDGEYPFGQLRATSRAGVARYLDGTLIGTALPLLEVVRRFRDYTGCDLAEAVGTASRNAVRALGIENRKGAIEPRKDADLVVLDGDGSVWATVVEGDVVYRKDGSETGR